MKNLIIFKNILVLLVLVCLMRQCMASLITFTCPTEKSDPLPTISPSFATEIRINYPGKLYTTEMKHSVDKKGGREAMELWSPQKHVKYILYKGQQLLIKYGEDDSNLTCTVKFSNRLVLEPQDAGPDMILQKMSVIAEQHLKDFRVATTSLESGIFMRKWEGCFKDPGINISFGFTEVDWKHPRSPTTKKLMFPVLAEAQINNEYLVSTFHNFDPEMPDNVDFQPPENCYCEGYRTDKETPEMKNFFSYDSEMIVFESAEGISPLVSRRKVYYDYRSKIARTDLYDPIAENNDMFSKVKAKGISIIHDFNSNTQYNIDLETGRCSVEDFMITINVADVRPVKNNELLNGAEFFFLDAKKSYNGQFVTRGYLADVYTSRIRRTEGNYIVTWYFSAVRTQIVENDKIEQNVLLRMMIQPEGQIGYQGRIDINFYNFRKEEPTALVYDISGCYNESVSKTFVITFPANTKLRGLENYLKLPIHLALKDLTGLSQQRLIVTEVNFNDKYMFAEFKILDSPAVFKKSNIQEMTLKQAIKKLKQAISKDEFKVTISSGQDLIVLKPEPNGFNEFAGDRHLPSNDNTYKQGSVVALTIGMLLLGIILGGIAINLVITRKYGVSLFQKSTGLSRFDNSLNESSM